MDHLFDVDHFKGTGYITRYPFDRPCSPYPSNHTPGQYIPERRRWSPIEPFTSSLKRKDFVHPSWFDLPALQSLWASYPCRMRLPFSLAFRVSLQPRRHHFSLSSFLLSWLHPVCPSSLLFLHSSLVSLVILLFFLPCQPAWGRCCSSSLLRWPGALVLVLAIVLVLLPVVRFVVVGFWSWCCVREGSDRSVCPGYSGLSDFFYDSCGVERGGCVVCRGALIGGLELLLLMESRSGFPSLWSVYMRSGDRIPTGLCFPQRTSENLTSKGGWIAKSSWDLISHR